MRTFFRHLYGFAKPLCVTILAVLASPPALQAQSTLLKPEEPPVTTPNTAPSTPAQPKKKKRPATIPTLAKHTPIISSEQGQARNAPPEAERSRGKEIVGFVQGFDEDGHLRIGSQTVILSGLFPVHLGETESAFRGWIDRNGGQVRCVVAPVSSLIQDKAAAAPNYTCYVNGLDVGLALIINGAAKMELDGPKEYLDQSLLRQKRDDASVDPDPKFAAFLEGSANLDCQSFTCTMRFASNYHQSQILMAEREWKQLANNVLDLGFREDINYYWLGRAAEALGALKAAAIYYQKAEQLMRTDDSLDHCRDASTDNCGNINLASELSAHLAAASSIANYYFQ